MKNDFKKYFCVNSASEGHGEIFIEGDISDSAWWDDEVSPKDVAESLKGIGSVNSLDVYINSYGGSCVAGNTIVNIIDDYKQRNNSKVNVHIRGIAASMGSGIAMVGDNVSMADNALFMVHKPLTMVCGNADDLNKAVEMLDKTENTLVKNYMRKFNGTEDELRELMKNETWLNADEAKEYGFVDEVTEGVKIAAMANGEGVIVGDKSFNKKVADLINKKNPLAQKVEKEDNALNYDVKLEEFGVNEEAFNSFEIESEKVLKIAELVKDKFFVEPVEAFVEKDEVCKALGCEDITAEELIDFAKAGKNPVVDEAAASNAIKAKSYDEIVMTEREKATANAVKALGNLYDENRVKKMLSVLDYSDIIAQSEAWEKEAEIALNAGNRVTKADSGYTQSANGNYINPKDCMV